jgi:hypothetical protein
MVVVTNGARDVVQNGVPRSTAGAKLLKTGQTTVYHAGDDGSYQKGIAKSYTVLTAAPYAGTTNVDSPGYAAPTLSFTAATKTIADTAALLATFKTGDTIRVRGSVGNDGVYTVATGNVAGAIVTTEALADELAGAYITICKRVTPSNNCVLDNNTGLMWRRYTTGGPAEKVGPASDGKLVWYDATKAYVLHPAGADLQMIASPATLRIVGGAGEVARYFVGACLGLSGFANAVNNRSGKVITSVAVNGADLDIGLQTFGATLIDEAAAGARAIALICQSIFSYCAAMNVAALAGYSDWRVPERPAFMSIMGAEAPNALPNATAYPSWPADSAWSGTTRPDSTTRVGKAQYAAGYFDQDLKTAVQFAGYVRGGV